MGELSELASTDRLPFKTVEKTLTLLDDNRAFQKRTHLVSFIASYFRLQPNPISHEWG
jgi:hypothetical protein